MGLGDALVIEFSPRQPLAESDGIFT